MKLLSCYTCITKIFIESPDIVSTFNTYYVPGIINYNICILLILLGIFYTSTRLDIILGRTSQSINHF